MSRLLNASCVLLFVVLFPSFTHAKVQEHKIYRVTRVIDGDSFVLNTGDHVRLIGVDAPERQDNAKLRKDIQQRHSSKSAELARGRQAHHFMKKLVAGKKLRLEFDRDKYDEYDRVLAYAYLTNGTFVNAKIIKEGYAYPYPVKPDLKHARLLNELYAEARQSRRGLWKDTRKKSFQWFK